MEGLTLAEEEVSAEEEASAETDQEEEVEEDMTTSDTLTSLTGPIKPYIEIEPQEVTSGTEVRAREDLRVEIETGEANPAKPDM